MTTNEAGKSSNGKLMDTFECSRCFRDVGMLVDSGCHDKPELLKDSPIGMYHCPDCGTMVLAGVEHPKVCVDCSNWIKHNL